eukprot:comp22873_c1_seq1/m.36125 comp22873_c1_seq1/g.36125  ORF comp22873_c1_seq1/g.36125 comp22873_c1_seq1/m.36125 type:complete len:408 (-) comp22873_c1_seq1:117-1340(-)
MPRFEDSFWGNGGEDWTGPFNGFETLVKRLRESKSMTEAMVEFCKQRAAAEKAYGEALQKIAASVTHRDNHGELRKAWDAMMLGMQESGRAHVELSNTLTKDVVPRIRAFADEQRATRKATVDNFQKQHTARAKAYEKMAKTKKDYESKCKDSDQATEAVTNPPVGQKPKDAEKARSKAEKCKQNAQAADSAYQDAVRQLDEVRLTWEAEFATCCRRFQELEEARIEKTKSEISEVANMQQHLAEADAKAGQAIGQAAGCIVMANEIESFIADRQTGTTKPAPIPYINFYAPTTSASRTPSQMAVSNPSTSSQHTEPTGDLASAHVVSAPAPAAATVPQQPPPPTVPPVLFTCKALYDYAAQGPEELTFSADDVMQVLSTSEDPWWMCSHVTGGKQGMVYKEYVEQI